MNSERTDAILSEILNEHESISGFFDSVFGFLARRSDFYCEITSPSDKIGFPPGVNEKIVLKTLRKWKNNVIKTANEIPVAYEKEITTSTDDEVATSSDFMPESHDIKNDGSRLTFEPSEFYNGACFPQYCWSQTINEIELSVLMPDHIITSKHLRVSIDQLSVKIIDQSTQAVILDDTLARKWKVSEANWTLAGRKLQIIVVECGPPKPKLWLTTDSEKKINAISYLDKMSEAWWEKLFVSEPRLDTTKLNCSRPIENLSQDTQAMIRKMPWDNQQKQLGNPTSKERTNFQMLQKAWNVEGSPFKGTPFDPNAVTFQN